eukprot:3633886-Lingulodinium_polyedra.AAC.1
MMRLGIDDVLRRANVQGALAVSFYAEINDDLDGCVQQRWRYTHEHRLEQPHSWLTRGVWDLLRRVADAFRTVLSSVPQASMLPI